MVMKIQAIALCAFALASASALPIASAVPGPFTWASTDVESLPTDVTGGGYQFQTNTAPGDPATESVSLSGDWGSALGFASANLTTGQLKVEAAASNPVGGSSPYVNVNAYFGDSFTTATASSQPFTWSSSTTAQFSMSLDGTLSPTNNLADEGASVFVLLALYSKGTLDSSSLLGSNLIGEPYLWTIGNPNVQLYYTPQGGTSTPITTTGTFDSIPSNITQTITPGGDFDWVLLVGAGGQPGTGQSFDADLSHTITLAYQGPQGSITTSDSGLFQNITTATPEPTSLAILALGFGATLTRRRNTPNRTH